MNDYHQWMIEGQGPEGLCSEELAWGPFDDALDRSDEEYEWWHMMKERRHRFAEMYKQLAACHAQSPVVLIEPLALPPDGPVKHKKKKRKHQSHGNQDPTST